ncbi:hypothetical protein I79_000285 [Cricetulus griseus]|uniref:Uncharacterized protein n=1 Tax=Cricetulus griseus TaxID=10029 RepID=G3GRZ0_CRIGR|nr:hypothetical protein I79_000285 [Cricetulus griseus]
MPNKADGLPNPKGTTVLTPMPVFTEEIPEGRHRGSLQMFLQMYLQVIPSVTKKSQDS